MYWYDASGNRTLKNEYRNDAEGNITSKFIRSTYNEMNQLVESIDSETGEATAYTYDDYGNLINDGKYEYTYDSYYNRLSSTRNLETLAYTSYDYYVDGLRSSKRGSWYIWLDGNMVYEFTSSDSDTYTYGHRLLYSDDVKYVLNAHGDVVALLNNSGVVTKRYDYDAYGNELSIDNTDTNPFRYCGEYFDVETGQIYLRNRYYQPITGRFSQLDPIRDGLNWYAYCWNNPVVFIDPTGLAVYFDGTAADKIELSLVLDMLVDGYVEYDADTGFVTYIKDSNSNEHSQSNELLKLLIDSPYDIRFSVESGTLGSGTEIKAYSNGEEYVSIEFYPNTEVGFYVKTDSGIDVDYQRVPHIELAHEMIHAAANVYESENDRGEYMTFSCVINNMKYTDSGEYPKEEYYAIGVIGSRPITENSIREEHGLPQRIMYGVKK